MATTTSARPASGGNAENGIANDEEMVDAFSEAIEDILQSAEDRKAAMAASSDQFDASMQTEPRAKHDHQASVNRERASDTTTGPLSAHEIEQLVLLCASVTSESTDRSSDEPDRAVGFAAVDGDTLTDLMPMLEVHVRKAENVDLIREAHQAMKQQKDGGSDIVEQWMTQIVPERVSIVRQGMEAASVMLAIMTSPGVDRRVLSDDSIEACIAILRQHLNKNIVPAITNTGHLVCMGNEATNSGKLGRPPAKKLKKSTSHLVRQEKQTLGVMKQLYKPAISSIGILSVLMERIEMLLRTVQLDDRPLLTLCSGVLPTFSMETTAANASMCHLLQVSSVGLITAVFRKYPRHRAVIVEDIFPVMLNLPTKRLRTYPIDLSNRQGAVSDKKKPTNRASGQPCIQVVTALVLSLIQSCVVMPTLDSSEKAVVKNGNTTEPPSTKLAYGLEQCQSMCDLFATKLLQRSNRKSNDGGASEFRPILSNLVDDLLVLLLSPVHPAAEMLLLSLCRIISNDLIRASNKKGPNAEVTYLTTALDVMGKVCASMARHLVAHRENPQKVSRPTSESRESGKVDSIDANDCYCGRSSKVDAFMISCDRCSAWFHGTCLGIARDDVPEESWVCDDCRIQFMVLEHTQSFAEQSRRKSKKARKTQDGVNAGIDETHVLRQLLLNYLSHLSHTTKSPSIKSSREFHIAKWVRELDNLRRSSDAASQDSVLDPGVLCDHFVTQWDTPVESHIPEDLVAWSSGQTFPCLSVEGNARLSLTLLATKSDMAIAYPRMMGVMVSLMKSSLPSLRKLSVKAISQVVEADPKIMLQTAMRTAVSNRFVDESISVREAAVALVGSYVLQTPALANAFHAPLLSRVSDPGVSVRKRTVRILRDILLKNPAYRGRAGACSALLQRAADPREDDGVRDLIHSLFHTLWLESDDSPLPPKNGAELPAETPSSLSVNGDNGGVVEHGTRVGVVTPSETPVAKSSREPKVPTRTNLQLRCDMAAEQMVEVVKSSGSGDILVSLMEELLSGFSDAEKDRKAAERRKRQEAAQRHCEHLVESLIEQLVSLDESSSGDKAGLVAIIRTIEVFAKASPDLVLNHIDPILPYLKADNGVSQRDEAAIVCATCSIVTHLAPIMGRTEIRQITQGSISDDLVEITKNLGATDAVSSAIKALASLANHKDVEPNGSLQKKVMSLASSFYKYLYKNKDLMDDVASVSGKTRRRIHRALAVLGSLCRHLDVEEAGDANNDLSGYLVDIDPDSLSRSNIPMACYGAFSAYLEKDDVETKCAALASMGGIFASQPRVMLAVEQAGIISEVMSESAHADLQLNALRCWRDILIAEELRIDTGVAKASMETREEVTVSKRISGDQDGDSSLVGGCLAKHAPRLFEMTSSNDERIRLATVELLGDLLRQGLINPMETVPYLLALQGDVRAPAIRSAALKLLIREGEKRPEMLRQRVCAGIRQAAEFQRAVYPNDTRVTAVVQRKHGRDVRIESVFCSIFTECIRTSRKQRESLYRNLLGLFDEESDNGNHKTESRYPYTQKLPMLSFVASTLAHLPYNTSSDPLFIIYHISCSAALHGEQLLDKLAKILGCDELDEDNTEEDCLERASRAQAPSQTKEAALLKAPEFDLTSFAELCAEGNSVVLLLRLKEFLCKVYSLSETRCLGYTPNGNIVDKGICSPDKMPLFNSSFYSCVYVAVKSTKSNISFDKDSLIRQYAEFRQTMRSIDTSDCIFGHSGEGPGNGAKKRGKKRKAGVLSDDSDSESS